MVRGVSDVMVNELAHLHDQDRMDRVRDVGLLGHRSTDLAGGGQLDICVARALARKLELA